MNPVHMSDLVIRLFTVHTAHDVAIWVLRSVGSKLAEAEAMPAYVPHTALSALSTVVIFGIDMTANRV